VFTLLKPKNRSILGIDISSTSIKAIEISTIKGHRSIVQYAIEPLPSHAIQNNNFKDLEVITQTLKNLLKNALFSTKKTVVAIPDSLVISKIVPVSEALVEAEIAEFLMMEAFTHIPFPLKEINFDFEILGPSPLQSGLVDIQLVASKSEQVKSRVKILSAAGLESKIIEVESCAIQRAIHQVSQNFLDQFGHTIIAVIDVGACFSNFYVFQDNKLIFARDEKFESMPLDNFEVISQIKRNLQFFFSTENPKAIDHLFLTGGSLRSSQIAKSVQDETGIEASIASTFKNLSISKNIDESQLMHDEGRLMLAYGLALRTV
jgi:type IV pilus assembly protein PilM